MLVCSNHFALCKIHLKSQPNCFVNKNCFAKQTDIEKNSFERDMLNVYWTFLFVFTRGTIFQHLFGEITNSLYVYVCCVYFTTWFYHSAERKKIKLLHYLSKKSCTVEPNSKNRIYVRCLSP